jgi:hypothetical protein
LYHSNTGTGNPANLERKIKYMFLVCTGTMILFFCLGSAGVFLILVPVIFFFKFSNKIDEFRLWTIQGEDLNLSCKYPNHISRKQCCGSETFCYGVLYPDPTLKKFRIRFRI